MQNVVNIQSDVPQIASQQFVHLRCHSEYSIVDGIVRIDDYIDVASKDNMPAVALTDLSNLFGAIKFYKAARSRGIKPILGCDIWLENTKNRDQAHRLLLLVQNTVGYRQLCALLSRAYLENQYRGRAEIKREWLQDAEGLLLISGHAQSDIGAALNAGNTSLATQLTHAWSELFPDRFYLEIQRVDEPKDNPAQEILIQQILDLAGIADLPVVATHPIQFTTPDDFKAHEARTCIAEGYMLADKRRPKNFTQQQYFKSQAEMCALFADVPEALLNSVEIAKRCNLLIELGKNYLPNFTPPDQSSLDTYLVAQSHVGLAARLKSLFPEEVKRDAKRPEYEARLEFECKIINQMGFAGYFLIVADFI
ncbi:MAG: PHP domain-containing protein, partial [Pseudomonadota bacterium]